MTSLKRHRSSAGRSIFTLFALAIIVVMATGERVMADNGGLLWKQRGAEIASHEAPKEPSLVPVVISAMAGGVMGIEIAVVGVGVATGATTSWWILGSAGAAIGAVSGAYLGNYFFNPAPEPQTAKTAIRSAQKQ